MNTMVLEHAGERLLIDCGLMFPRGDQPGVDVVLPDFTWLKDAAESLKGIVLTHAHEDHLGALPWLLREVNVPVYGTAFTLALARHRLDEAGVTADLREMAPRTAFKVGESLQHRADAGDALGARRGGPGGEDARGHRGAHRRLQARRHAHRRAAAPISSGWASWAKRASRCCCPTRPTPRSPGGRAASGWCARPSSGIFGATKGRIVIAMFGSHLHRVRHAIELARSLGRRVLLLGRSLQRNVELAQSVGILEAYKDVLVPFEAAPLIPGSQLLILCTGAQAEPRSALIGLLNPEPGPLRLEPTDTVILSSRTIPGNEGEVSGLINRLLARGVKVITSAHRAGHSRVGARRARRAAAGARGRQAEALRAHSRGAAAPARPPLAGQGGGADRRAALPRRRRRRAGLRSAKARGRWAGCPRAGT